MTRSCEPKDAINVYRCTAEGCYWQAVTVNRDEGHTPRFIPCERHPQHRAESACYCVDQTLTPTHEWSRPSSEEIARKPWLAGYAARGGLQLRSLRVLCPS